MESVSVLNHHYLNNKCNEFYVNFIAYILLFIFSLSGLSYSQTKDSVTVTKIFPGIIHKQIIDKKDTLVINVLQINLKSDKYKTECIKAHNLLKARETASALSKRITDSSNTVLAAINADFFEIKTGGEVINNMISNGKFVKAIHRTKSRIYPQFALTNNNKPLIENFNFDGKIILQDGSEFNIDRINSRTDSAKITLYNSFQGRFTPAYPKNREELEINFLPAGHKLDTLYFTVGKEYLNHGKNKIPNYGFIFSTNNNLASLLKNQFHSGDTVKVLLQMIPNLGKIINLTGGLPRLVKNGVNLAAGNDTVGGTHSFFSVTKHPRTGIGFSKDSTQIYFITVDGRQESSSGMSLSQFAGLMISQGIYQGLNLDGGGSTTMVINGKVVNHPSDIEGERPVGNCLIVIKK